MANLSDIFNVVGRESLVQAPENTFADKVKRQQQSLQKLQSKLTEAQQPKVQDIVNQKLSTLTGKNRANEGLVQKSADMAIQKLLHQGEQAEMMPMGDMTQTDGEAQPVSQSAGQAGFSKVTTPTRNSLQKSLTSSNTILQDTIMLYNNFNPEYFTYGSRLSLAGQQLAEKVLGEGEYFKDPEAAKKQAQYFQKAQTAFFNWVKEQSGAQVSDAEMKRRLKARFNPAMSPSEAKGALLNMMQEVVTHRMALKSMLKEGFSLDKEVDRKRMLKMINAQKKLQGPKIDAYIKKFMANPHNKAAGATKMDAMLMYMQKHDLLGSGGNNGQR